MSRRQPIEWEILDHREDDTFRLELKRHDRLDVETKPFRITVSRKGGDTEHEDHDSLNQAVLAFDEYCVVTGVTKFEVLPPVTPDEIYATWQMKIRQNKDIDKLGELEDEMMADPMVKEHAAEILQRCGTNRQVSTTIIRRVCEAHLEEARKAELVAVKEIAGFGRFG